MNKKITSEQVWDFVLEWAAMSREQYNTLLHTMHSSRLDDAVCKMASERIGVILE